MLLTTNHLWWTWESPTIEPAQMPSTTRWRNWSIRARLLFWVECVMNEWLEHSNKGWQLPTFIPLPESWAMTAKWKQSQDTKDDINNRLSSRTAVNRLAPAVESRTHQLFHSYFLFSIYTVIPFSLIITVTSIHQDIQPQCKCRLLI